MPDNPQIRDLVCFLNEWADVYVDGERLERPTTQWSGVFANVQGGGSEQGPHGTE